MGFKTDPWGTPAHKQPTPDSVPFNTNIYINFSLAFSLDIPLHIN
jgi:hypothetical protein